MRNIEVMHDNILKLLVCYEGLGQRRIAVECFMLLYLPGQNVYENLESSRENIKMRF
jgi:hypothetical protein